MQGAGKDPMKIVVLKIGGKELNKKRGLAKFISCAKKIRARGVSCIVVHGGGNEVDARLGKLGIKPKFINGLRATDKETMDVVESMLCWKVNKSIVSAFVKNKVNAAGLSGKDGGMVLAKKVKNKALGLVGEVQRVNPEIIMALIKAHIVPVVATVAADARGDSLNVNADMFASAFADALRAQCLVLVSDVPGVYDASNNVIPSLSAGEAKKLMRAPVIKSGMLPKLSACVDAVGNGVKRAYILDSKTLSLNLKDVLAGRACGTMIHSGG